jgi:anti-sigma B factor antagonist
MKIVERQVGDVVVLDIDGKILVGDEGTLQEAIAKLTGARKLKVLLNMADVPYVDSIGLQEIVRAYTDVSREGGRLKLFALTKKVEDLLALVKLLTVLETHDTEDEARRSF